MKSSDKILTILVVCSLMTACVTTTTRTGGAQPASDEKQAAELNYELGARYYRNGNYELARDRLLSTIELAPKNGVAHYTLALTYEQLGNLRLAADSYEQAVRVAPNDFNVQNAYAVFLCNQGRFDDARKQFDRAIKVRTNDLSQITMTNAGVCMMQIPDHTAAENYFRQALDKNSNYGEALLQLSVLKFSTEDYLGARAFLQRFLSANVPSADVLFLGVQIEEQLGDDRAKTDFSNRILREFPQSPEARRILESG